MSSGAAESLKDASAICCNSYLDSNEKKNKNPPESDNVSKFHLGQETLRGRTRGGLSATCESIQRHTFGLILN